MIIESPKTILRFSKFVDSLVAVTMTMRRSTQCRFSPQLQCQETEGKYASLACREILLQEILDMLESLKHCRQWTTLMKSECCQSIDTTSR